MQLEVVNADGRDDVAFASGIARTVGEYDFIVALAASQQTQILKKGEETVFHSESQNVEV